MEGPVLLFHSDFINNDITDVVPNLVNAFRHVARSFTQDSDSTAAEACSSVPSMFMEVYIHMTAVPPLPSCRVIAINSSDLALNKNALLPLEVHTHFVKQKNSYPASLPTSLAARGECLESRNVV